ncbi:TPA: tyrosine-type recombinase/integrase [Salmonella enterica]
MALTDVKVRTAKACSKSYKLTDGEGMHLLVHTNGSKYWRLQYRFGGKQKLLALGVYPTISLADARIRRSEAKKQLANGIDPGEQKKADKRQQMLPNDNTFQALVTEWHQFKSASWSKGYADDLMEAFVKDIFPLVGDRPVTEIKPLEMLTALRKIEARGALDKLRKIRQACNQAYRYAVATGRVEYNPISDLSKALTPPKSQHYPHLSADELPAFLTALSGYTGSPIIQMATYLLMLTAVRTIELRAAEWAEFDLDKAIWEIPPERMKMRRPHIVPLSHQAVSILKALFNVSGRYRLVFPGRNDVNKPMSEASVNQLIKRIGYHGKLTGHGFRHTMSTILHDKGFNSSWIELQLAHVDKNAIRGTYNHAQYLDNRREMMQWYADYIDELGKGH